MLRNRTLFSLSRPRLRPHATTSTITEDSPDPSLVGQPVTVRSGSIRLALAYTRRTAPGVITSQSRTTRVVYACGARVTVVMRSAAMRPTGMFVSMKNCRPRGLP